MTHIYETYDFSLFEGRFRDYDRVRSFGFNGLKALYDYLLEYAEDTGVPVEFDCISLCCDYCRYENMQELTECFPDIETMEALEDHTTVIVIEGTDAFIIANF